VVHAQRLQQRSAPLIELAVLGRATNPLLRARERVARPVSDGAHAVKESASGSSAAPGPARSDGGFVGCGHTTSHGQ
jgi:hypothetical protein